MEVSVGKEQPLVLQAVPVTDAREQVEQFEPVPVVVEDDKDDLEAPAASDRALIQKLEEAADFEPIQQNVDA